MTDGIGRSRTSGFRLFAAAYAGSAGSASLRLVVPIYVGIAVVCAVILGPTGMHPSDVVSAVDGSLGFRLGLWLAWILAIAPAARALFRDPAIGYLRALPVGVFGAALLGAVGLLLLQTPWIALFSASGWSAALAAGAAAAGVHALISMRGRWRWLAVAGLGAAIAAPAPALATAGLGALAMVFAIPAAWARSVERGGARGVRIRGGRLVALAASYALGVARLAPAALARGAIIAAVGGGLVLLAHRANGFEVAEAAVFSLAVGAVTLAIAVSAIAGPLIDAERSARWLLDSTGAGGGVRAGAASIVAGMWGLVVGGAHGALSIAASPTLAGARVIAEGAGMGCALALIAVRGARWAERREGIDGSRVVIVMTPVAVAMLIAVGWVGELALMALAALAILATASSAAIAAVPSRQWELVRRRRVP